MKINPKQLRDNTLTEYNVIRKRCVTLMNLMLTDGNMSGVSRMEFDNLRDRALKLQFDLEILDEIAFEVM